MFGKPGRLFPFCLNGTFERSDRSRCPKMVRALCRMLRARRRGDAVSRSLSDMHASLLAGVCDCDTALQVGGGLGLLPTMACGLRLAAPPQKNPYKRKERCETLLASLPRIVSLVWL